MTSARAMKPGRRFRLSQGLLTMLIAVFVLFAISALFASSSVAPGTIRSMLPFAAVLAIAGLGQMLVVQQGGFDLSVPGSMGLAIVLVTHIPKGDDSILLPAVLLAYAFAIGAGLVNGILVGRFGLNAIIATLGMNALLFGVIMAISGGTPRITTKALAGIAGGTSLGIPNSVIILAVVLAIVIIVLKKTVAGRRFEAIGGSKSVATALGMRVRTNNAAAYIWAQVLYVTAGIVLAGINSQPTAYLGENYLLPSVAVVVLGGTSLLGGKGFPAATVVAALFLTQLDQFTMAFGMPYAGRSLIQAIALAIGVAIYTINWSAVGRRLRALQRERELATA